MKINKDDLGFVYSIYQKIRYWRIKRIHEKIVTGMVWKLMLEEDKTKIDKAFSYGWSYVEKTIIEIFAIQIALVEVRNEESTKKLYSKEMMNKMIYIYNNLLIDIGQDNVEWITDKFMSNIFKKAKKAPIDELIQPYK